MNNQHTADLLDGLKLKGMSKAFTAMIQMPLQQRPGMELAVAKLVDAERLYRKNLKTEIYLKTSHLRYNPKLSISTSILQKSSFFRELMHRKLIKFNRL